MAGARAVAVAATSPTARFNSGLATRRGFRVSCGHEHGPRASAAGAAASARNIPARVPACFSRNPADAEAETEANTGQILQDDSSYLWKLGLGSVGGAAAIKYGSILFPDITRPNIIQALLMVWLPVAVAILVLFKLSSTED